MSSTKHKLRMAGAFAALATLALAVSCRGFFVNPTLTTITISPSAPQVQLNSTLPLSVYGTYNDGSTGQVSTGVSWSSDTPTVASFTSPTSNVLQGLTVGTSTITANVQAVTATATATVYLTGITAITVSPNSNSVSITTGSPASYTASATANGTQVDITGTGSWTLNPTSSDVSCSFVTPDEQCSAFTGAGTGNYTITVGYPGTTIVGTATLTVNP